MDMTRLDWLWTSSWQASVLAGVVLVLQVSLGRRWNARWRLALWWVVVAKLLVPVTLPMPVSIYPKWIGWETGSRVLPEAAIDKPDRGWEAGISVPRVSLGETPSSETGFGGSVAARSKGEGRLPERDRVTESFATAIPRTGIHLPRQWLMGIWGVGCLALLMWQMIQALVLSRRIRAEASPAEPRWLRLVEWCRNELGIRRPVRLCVVPWLRGPAVFGWRQPVVLLPASMAGDLDERSMRHMVLHELAHVRRGDLGTNVVLVVLQAVHWFNPVLWLVFRRMREDRELAADELAMTHLAPGEASLYGMTLIQAVEMGSRLRPSSVALGMVGGKACLRRRLRASVRFQAGGLRNRAGRMVMALLFATAFAGPAHEVSRRASERVPARSDYYGVEKRFQSAADLADRIQEIHDAVPTWIDAVVVDDAGKSIPDAKVVVAPFGEPRLRREVEVVQGRFEIAVLDSEKRLVAIQAPGFAPRLLRRVGDRDRTPERVVLDRGRTVEGSVVDEAGNPLAGTALGLQSEAGESLDDPLLGLEVTTDAEGRFRWTHAPRRSLRLVAGKDGFEPEMMELLAEPSTAAEFRLRRAFELNIGVVDEDTGEPLDPSEILVRWVPWGSPVEERHGWQRASENLRIETTPGRVSVRRHRRWSTPAGDLQLQIVVAGYRPEVTDAVEISGAQRQSLRLRRALRWLGRVTDTRGNVVHGAQVTFLDHGMTTLDHGRLRSWNGLGPGIVATSADGDFELPAALPSARVVAVHPHLGFAEMDYGVLERTRVIQLQPWGRIEGTLTSGSKVVPEANVILLRRRAMGAEGMELSSHQAVTGPDGRFRLDTVPPGLLVLGRDWPVGDGREGRTFSPVGEVEVSPGETARVELGCGGRTIVGRVIANPEGRMLAGYSGFHGLYRKMPPPLGPMATRADYEARARTVRALADTGFPTVFSAVWEGNQGRFVVEDVPPGTYDLRFGFTTDWLSSYPRRLPRILGTLSREVVVPAASEGHGDGPLDVGLLQVSFDTAEDDEW